MPERSVVAYESLLAKALEAGSEVAPYLRRELPDLWYDEYRQSTPRLTNVLTFTHETFDYLYDDLATLEATGQVIADALAESRLVAAIGVSRPRAARRDDARLRGWVGPTEQRFGRRWDKGHFVAHSIGGAVDGIEANVFQQLRSLNRGWSTEGREYRRMEQYCTSQRGILCFSHPVYDDQSACPARLEFGILKPSGELWVRIFANR